MNRPLILLIALILTGCARTPQVLKQARHAGLIRQGGGRTTDLLLTAVQLTHSPAAPYTASGTMPAFTPPPLDSGALTASLAEQWLRSGQAMGLTVAVVEQPSAQWSEGQPSDITARLGAASALGHGAAATLEVTVGWCAVGDELTPCVRSPDTALGYGPPAITMTVYRRLRLKKGRTIARRASVVHKAYTFHIDPTTGAHGDRAYVGRGETVQHQADDAVRQAVDGAVATYVGRRRLLRLAD